MAAAILLGLPLLEGGNEERGSELPPDTGTVEPGAGMRPDSLAAGRQRAWEAALQFDSYLGFMVEDGTQVGLARWLDHTEEPLKIYLPTTNLDGYTAGHRRAALEAFSRWSRVGTRVIPVVFSFVRDSGLAEVVVDWVPHLPENKAGRATTVRDGYGWIRRGRLELALGLPGGRHFNEEETYTIALHEIGHLLGLGHSDDPEDVMYPMTRIQDLSLRDRTTARLLYQILPGPLPSR